MWWGALAALFLFCALLAGSLFDPIMTANLGLRLMMWSFCVMPLWAFLYLALAIFRDAVIADEAGLRWRAGFGGWKAARWDEVSDFYLRELGGRTVETPAGEIELGSRYEGIEAIIELLPQRALNARAREWGVRGYRSNEDWSQTLALWPGAQKWKAPFLTALSAVDAVVLLAVAAINIFSRVSSGPLPAFSGWLLLSLLFPASFAGLIAWGCIWTIRQGWQERKVAWERRDETLEMNARGVVFRGESGRVVARWDQVQRVKSLGKSGGVRRYRVVTANGEFVIWKLSDAFGMWTPFVTRCRSYAPAALEGLPLDNASEDLAEELSPHFVLDGDETQVFSFRTRTNRLIVACVASGLSLAPLMILVMAYNSAFDEPFAPSWMAYNSAFDEPFAPSWPLFGGLCAVAIAVSGALWLWFARAHRRRC